MASKTSLLEAVRTFDWKAVDADLQERPDLLGHREERGKDRLFAACWNDDVDALDLLLGYGALVDEATSGRETPCLGAITWSRFRFAEALLKRGADVNAGSDQGLTAFQIMLKKGSDFGRLAMLAKHGARGDIPGPDRRTAIESMSRKRDERFRNLARRLDAGSPLG